MRRMQTIEKVIGENTFYIRPFGAFAAANISGELAALLSPILAGIAPLFGGLDTGDGGSDAAANPLDMDIEEAMPAISSALSTISGNKVERMMRRLLIDQQNISVQGEDTDGDTVILDKDLADEVFCGELQDKLYRAIIIINYEAICCGAEGADEIVVRKFIESSVGMTPCIYNGLPLRPEFRVFYDFDVRKPIFTANYWDYDYVYPHLYHVTDKIIFEHERERLEGVYAHFKDAVQDKVADAMQNVQGLTGQWSVDVLMDEREKFWLIDMAIAQRSAYWEMRPEGYAE